MGNAPKRMSDRQRAALRDAFARLGVAAAKDQFALVETLTGQRITSPQDLDNRQAQALLIQLNRRADQATRVSTGNAWADREEETWIDKL
ncbi:hypothetical protein QDR37_11315 [Amnibacterium sp. CER49]|uniref:hypothetical protein n=1 Tax=Amnibacterium sp. CER49 TaxID=3039161 RepID=UPI00244AC4A1|nr:hypothetical protein [Amnibacterium sp. CER49]MDH2444534.1 hypothetical protein [Amnibacterium sp. CER49]